MGGGLIIIFTSGGGYKRGVSPPVPPVEVWSEAPAALLLRLFSLKINILLTVISKKKLKNEIDTSPAYYSTIIISKGEYLLGIATKKLFIPHNGVVPILLSN